MDFEFFRPVLSGLIGGILAIIFCGALSRWVPRICDDKSATTLIRQNRIAIWVANTLFFGGLVAGIAVYQLGFLPSTDWRGLALGSGGGSLAALAVLPLQAILKGHSPKEAYVAYAIAQKTPIVLVYGILVLCATSFAVAASSLLAG